MSYSHKKTAANILDNDVFHYMSSKVVKLLDSTPLSTACDVMYKNNKDEIIVVDCNDTPIGIVTDEDMLKKIGEENVTPAKTRLDDIMIFWLIKIKYNDTLINALNIMGDNKVRKLVVVRDNGKIT
ncbi:MAG: CBS domain-containing protein, partial [Nitrosopumilus sp.]